MCFPLSYLHNEQSTKRLLYTKYKALLRDNIDVHVNMQEFEAYQKHQLKMKNKLDQTELVLKNQSCEVENHKNTDRLEIIISTFHFFST